MMLTVEAALRLRQAVLIKLHTYDSLPVPRALVFLGHARAGVHRDCGGAIVIVCHSSPLSVVYMIYTKGRGGGNYRHSCAGGGHWVTAVLHAPHTRKTQGQDNNINNDDDGTTAVSGSINSKQERGAKHKNMYIMIQRVLCALPLPVPTTSERGREKRKK